MAAEPIDGWVLWGFHPGYCDGEPIKLTGGVRAECRAALKRRSAEGFECAIYRAGTPPVGLRAQAAEAQD